MRRPPDDRPRACPGQETGSQETAPAGATSEASISDWYRAGLEHGIEIGRAEAEAEMAEAHHRLARELTGAVPFPELEERRWGAGGREHFADPRPGDYRGRRHRERAA